MNPKFFSAERNQKAEEIKEFLPINLNTDFRTIAPYMVQAEERYIKPVLGAELFDRLAAFYREPPGAQVATPEDKATAELLYCCQYASIYLAFWVGFDAISISISDNGAGVKIEEGKRLYRYQEDNLKKMFKEQGFNQIDTVLNYLVEHIEFFDSFKQSGCYPELLNSFVPDTDTFNRHYDIQNSRLVFLRMKTYIRKVEQIELPHVLGHAFMADLLARRDEPCYARIIPYIENYTVNMSLYRGIVALSMIPDERGLFYQSEVQTRSGGTGGMIKTAVEAGTLERRAQEHKQEAEQYLQSMILYMKAHKEEYALFFEYAGENAPVNHSVKRINSNKKTFWV